MTRPLLTMLACVFSVWSAAAAPEPSRDVTSTVEAIAVARHDVKLSFTIPGRVARVLVEPGDAVRAGQPIIALDDREQAARIAHLEQRASSDAEVRAARARLRLAMIEEQRARDAFSRDAAAGFEVERYELESELARIALEQAEQRRAEAAHELELARLRLHDHTILAPIDGVIEDVTVREGETVEPRTPAARLVDTGTVRIDARVPTAYTLGVRVGDVVSVRPAMGDAGRELEGRVVSMSSVADAASETRLVRVDAANTDGLPAGVRVFVVFGGARE